MPPDKSALSIRLNEPVVPLRRTYDRSPRDYDDDETPQPAVVRGLLTLELAKPTKVSSIELALNAKAITHYFQGAGPSRVDVTEKYRVHSAASTIFKAGPMPASPTSTTPTTQFLGEHAGSAAQDIHLYGAGHGRSTSIDPPIPTSSDRSEIDNPRQDCASSDLTPPYANPPDQPLLTPDAIAARSQSVDSSSRTAESPNSPTLSQNHLITDIPSDSSDSSTHSTHETARSSTLSFDDFGMHSESVAYHGLSRNRTVSSAPSLDRDRRGRSHSRFSFGKVVHVFETVKDRMRSQSRPDENEERGRSLTKSNPPASFSPVGPALPQIEATEPLVTDGTTYQSGDGWVLFPKGTYTYPIFFTIPNDSPPTMKADRGSLTWKVKAVVKHPSAFAMKMSVRKEVIVIGVPKASESEEVGIEVQREWDDQFQYRLQIARQGVPIGGKVPFHLTITPMAKIKLYSIMVYLDERTEYYTRAGSRVRTDAILRTTLLAIRRDSANQRFSDPILPLAPDEPFRKSPLYLFLRPEEDESEVASSFMGLGPWTIRHQLAIPDSCSLLCPSNRAQHSNIMVNHTLKVVLRVERDDGTVTTGRKKLYDIAIQAPIQIFSCRCTSEWTSLPRYDEAMRSVGELPEDTYACPCRARQPRRDAHATLPFFQARATSLPTPNRNPRDSLASRARVHERLISGLVSERGEAPPSYERCETPCA